MKMHIHLHQTLFESCLMKGLKINGMPPICASVVPNNHMRIEQEVVITYI